MSESSSASAVFAGHGIRHANRANLQQRTQEVCSATVLDDMPVYHGTK